MAIIPPVGIAGMNIAGINTAGIGPAGFTPTVKPSTQVDPGAEQRGSEFGSKIIQALDDLQAAHTHTDQLAKAAATGDLKSVEEYMVTATQTQLATQLTVAVRNRAVESFNEIMRMQI